MARFFLFMSLALTHFAVLHQSAEEERTCSPYFCNDGIGEIHYPFKSKHDPPECGLFSVDCSDRSRPKIQLEDGGTWYEFTDISQPNMVSMIIDKEIQEQLEKDPCNDDGFNNFSFPSPSPVSNVSTTHNLTLFKCNHTLDPTIYGDHMYIPCPRSPYYYYTYHNSPTARLPQCPTLQLPLPPDKSSDKFILQVTVAEECYECYKEERKCMADKGEPICSGKDYHAGDKLPHAGDKLPHAGDKLPWKLGLGIGIGAATLVACLFFLWRYKQRRASSHYLSSNNSHSDPEGHSMYYGVSVFTYKELEEATNHFSCEKEIGDGGFGIVYHGKLKDGREVAVKRLYEHNYRRAEQFLNEIKILAGLRHKNLVSLYGCTSRRSSDLLIVFEYIPNGTVADHLHGDLAASGSLTWPIRMSIAIETATALRYLHAYDIVHRDVKTTNILLDDNFCVKVADFGISRLFPLNATHVSTAPQGTPGYVDPEYHQCYQLTSKSDVYSFGVVLIELISSLAAVDITRQRHDINLFNIAMNKIQHGLYSDLVDPCLGFESDDEVKRMTIAVADLAFQCLQQDSDKRPTMCEVLEALKKIESRNDMPENIKLDAGIERSIETLPSPECDKIGLLKSMVNPQSSPDSVIQKWPSTTSTSNASA